MTASDESIFEQARIHLPKYLTVDQQKRLFDELSSFPDNFNYYIKRDDLAGQLLQGDGWHGFWAVDFDTLNKKQISAAVISNSCDISGDNSRVKDPSILFAPLIRLEDYIDAYREYGGTDRQTNSHIEAIKKQRVTSIFYFPADPHGLSEEYIILLDDLKGHPLRAFLESSRQKHFTLSQYGFYLFLIKISIHFCRFQEGVMR